MEVNVKFSGFDEAIRTLRDMPEKAVKTSLRSAVKNGIKPAEEYARQTVPVGTGLSRDSLVTLTRFNRVKKAMVAWLGVKEEAFYAVTFVEFGTSKIPKDPWLRPAMNATKAEQVKRVGETLTRSIRKWAKRNK